MITNRLQYFADEAPAPEEAPAEDKAEKKAEKTYTEAEVNKMIDDVVGKKFSKWQKEQEQKISEAEKLAKMNEQERAEHEKAELKKELDAYKRRETLSEMKSTARKMLAESKINAQDELLNMLVSTDADETKSAINSFIEMYKADLDAGIKDAIKGNTPKTGSTKVITKEEIMAIKNPAERKKLIAENINLFQ